eukprot:10015477-Karenia_brevis.AAC.1
MMLKRNQNQLEQGTAVSCKVMQGHALPCEKCDSGGVPTTNQSQSRTQSVTVLLTPRRARGTEADS